MASILYFEVNLKSIYSCTYVHDSGMNIRQESIECQNIREWIEKHEALFPDLIFCLEIHSLFIY